MPKLDRLSEALTAKCKEAGLQPTKWFIGKIIQLYEMIKIQHGVVIIGSTMSCKTSSYR